MKIINPSVQVERFDPIAMMKRIEKAGRTCYKSDGNITEDSHRDFIRKVITNGHESVLEHEKVTARIICDRGVSHEIVRHRLAAYSQESTRYCNYAGDKFGNEITVIEPFFFEHGTFSYESWKSSCEVAEMRYLQLLNVCGRSAQEARSVLPNSLKTEIVVTYDLREWRHFFKLRAAKAAHPQMQQIAIPLLSSLRILMYPVFGDIDVNRDFSPNHYANVDWAE